MVGPTFEILFWVQYLAFCVLEVKDVYEVTKIPIENLTPEISLFHFTFIHIIFFKI